MMMTDTMTRWSLIAKCRSLPNVSMKSCVDKCMELATFCYRKIQLEWMWVVLAPFSSAHEKHCADRRCSCLVFAPIPAIAGWIYRRAFVSALAPAIRHPRPHTLYQCSRANCFSHSFAALSPNQRGTFEASSSCYLTSRLSSFSQFTYIRTPIMLFFFFFALYSKFNSFFRFWKCSRFFLHANA